MPRIMVIILRSILAVSIFILSPGLSGYAAAGQVLSATATGQAGFSTAQGNIPVMPGSSFSHVGISLTPASLLAAPMTTPAPALGRLLTSPVVRTSAPEVFPSQAAVLSDERVPLSLTAAPAQAEALGKEEAAPAVIGVLLKGAPADSSKPEAVEASAQRMGGLMDGSDLKARHADDSVPVMAGDAMTSHAAPLDKPQAAASAETRSALPSPASTSFKSPIAGKFILAAVVVGLVLLMPTVALAAGAPLAGTAYATTMLSYLHPGASMVAAAAGAVYGAVAAKSKDGATPSSGEVLGSVLRYGVLAGAGVYACMDISQTLFLGVRSAVSSLPTALATAALGQSAFQGKFTDPATSSADRIMSVFPAVAAALGLNLGTALLMGVPDLLSTLGVGAMTVTGVASLLYSVTYDPAKAPSDGPAHMARGYVLQALMTGLALAISNPFLVALFAALAVWGFADVLYASGRTVGKSLMDLLHKYWPPKSLDPKA